MKVQINQREARRLKIKFLPLFFLFLFACATIPVKTYEETVSQWKSYNDVAKWMSWNFSYDMKRMREYVEKHTYDNPMAVRTPKETFELKSGVCFDAARFAKETLNRIDPSYEAEFVFIDREGDIDHYVCSFKKDGKLYIMDYGMPYRNLIGVHGPYNSLEEYKKYFERIDPRRIKILSVTFGWPEWKKKEVLK
jgi:hypothetical protein